MIVSGPAGANILNVISLASVEVTNIGPQADNKGLIRVFLLPVVKEEKERKKERRVVKLLRVEV